MTDTKEKKTTEGEAVDQQIKSGNQQPIHGEQEPYPLIIDYMPDLTLNNERIVKHKDEKEKETGIFHWMFKDGRYEAVDELKDERLHLCAEHCVSKMNNLQDYIEVLFDQMCGWQYRLEHIEEEAERRGITLRINKPDADKEEDTQPEIVE